MRDLPSSRKLAALLGAALAAAAVPAALGAQAAATDVVTLAQCVDQALAGGPDVRTSAATLRAAQASYTSAASANSLGLSANGGATQAVPIASASPAGTGPASLTASGGLTLTGPLGLNVGLTASHQIVEDAALGQSTTVRLNAGAELWDGYPGGQGLAAVQQAALTLQGTQLSEDANRRSTVYSVKQSYYTLLAQQRQLSILQATLAQRQEELKKTQALYDAQSATGVDLKQAKVNLAQANLDLLKAQDALESDRESLSTLVGWPVDKAYTVAEVEDLPVPTLTVQDAIATALAQRADLKQLKLSEQAAAISVAVKKGQASPSISASAGMNYTRDWAAGTNQLDASLGVTVRGSIIDGGAAAAQAVQAAVQAEKLAVQEQQLTAQIATSVRGALASLRDLVARYALARDSLDLAQSRYDSTKIQYDSGVSSNLDVLGASVTLTSAQVSLAQARATMQLGVLALQSALGQ